MTSMGFTGRASGTTAVQARAVQRLIASLKPDRLLVGDCAGADEIAVALGHLGGVTVVGYPAEAGLPLRFDEVKAPQPPAERNHAIAVDCDYLVAVLPTDDHIPGSGTWQTVDFAREAGKVVFLVLPDGRVGVDLDGGRG